MDVIDLINRGITKSSLMHLIRFIGFTTQQISDLLPVTERTIQRYSSRQPFSPTVSELIIAIAEVIAKGVEVFDSKEQFRQWLSLPNRVLGDKTPLSLLKTKRGATLVMKILVRIEHGVYS